MEAQKGRLRFGNPMTRRILWLLFLESYMLKCVANKFKDLRRLSWDTLYINQITLVLHTLLENVYKPYSQP